MIKEFYVPPFPTILILQYFRIYIGTLDSCDMASNIETSVNQTFGFRTTLGIPNINPYYSYIQFQKGFDNIRF